MRIKNLGVHAAEDGLGLVVNASFALPGVTNITADRMAELTNAFEELCGSFGGEVSRDTGGNYAEDRAEATEEAAPEDPPKRRRRGASSADAEAGSTDDAKTAADSTSPSPESSDTPSTRRRRRGQSDPDTSDAPAAEESGDTTSSDASSAETKSPSDDEKPSRRRRGSSKPKDDGPTEVTDADLSKACSEAAMQITPKRVMEVLENFGVTTGNSRDLPAEKRQEFIDTLAAEYE